MTAFLRYLPFVLQSIIAVQMVAPTLKGEAKKKAALDLIALAAGLTAGLPNEHAQQIGAVVDGSVKVLKDAGVFGTDQAPTQTPIPAPVQ